MNDFTMDVDQIETLITEKTSAIVPVIKIKYACYFKSAGNKKGMINKMTLGPMQPY